MAGNMDEFDNGLSEEENNALLNEEQEEDTANPGEGEEKETPTATPTEEKTNDEDEGSDPENEPEPKDPWHKHPRWIAREKKLRELQERDAAREQELAELREKLDGVSQSIATAREEQEQGEEVTIPDWFVKLYGDDPDTYLEYLEAEEAKEQEREERLLRRIEERKQQESQKEEQDLKWVDDQLADLRENLEEGEPDFEDNDILRIIRDYTPSDGDGNLDFRKAYDILQLEKQKGTAPKPNSSVQDKKRIGARTQSASEPNPEEVASNESFAHGDKPW